MKIINVTGARPNLVKMAPLVREMNRYPDLFDHILVHTGQHYDQAMNERLFRELEIPAPDIDLRIGSGTHAEQTGKIMIGFERVCIDLDPALIIVPGDTNSTLACALAAKKLGIRVAHLEAGLRSHDMSMPEEINRICTDALSDLLFTTDTIASGNLIKQGIKKERIHFVGNLMIDTLLKYRPAAEQTDMLGELKLSHKGYAVVTLHRPSNVDDKATLVEILESLWELSADTPVIFPLHPRTGKMIKQHGLSHYFTRRSGHPGLRSTAPLGYLEFLNLVAHARLVLTDSGGLQEETTVLGVPCFTLRDNTERPITCTLGTNRIVGRNKKDILNAISRKSSGDEPCPTIPEKWDGKSAGRVVDILRQ